MNWLILLYLVLGMAPVLDSVGGGRKHRAHRRQIIRNSSKKYKLRQNVGVISSKNFLKTSMLNVDGLSDTSMYDVCNFVEKNSPDVVFILETKRRLEEMATDITIDGYDNFEVRRSDVAGHKQGGGIACYTRKSEGLVFHRHTPDIMNEQLEYVNNERVWLKIDSLKAKTAILSVYIGCQYEDDRYGEYNQGIYTVLCQEAIQLRSEGYRLEFIGDFNGHVGCSPLNGVVGNNPDQNRNGLRFLAFLESCDLRHINGECRIPGSQETRICEGLWTRQRGNSRSVIDFAGVSFEHVDAVVSMTVDDRGLFGGDSDHNWVTIVLEDKFKRLRILPSVRKKEKWNIQEDQDWESFQAAVLSNLPSVEDAAGMSVDDLASEVARALHSGGLSTIGLRKVNKKASMWSRQLPPDLVSELRKKRELEKCWKSLVASDWNELGVTAVHLADAEAAYLKQKAVVSSLFSGYRGAFNEKNLKDRACFWSTVSGKVKQSTDITAVMSQSGVLKCDPDAIRLEVEDHFVSVFKGSIESVPSALPTVQSSQDQSPPTNFDHKYAYNCSPTLPRIGNSECLDLNPDVWLGKSFTSKEIKIVAKTLLNNKACGWDALPNEFVKFSPDLLHSLLAILFNKIKDMKVFPRGWNRGRVTLLHKRGLRVLLGNYRPITVLISLAGLYSKVLNDRLVQVVERHDVLGDVQGGFRKGRGGADNLFILHTLLWKSKSKKKSIHMAFLDVSKAYDTVNREVLWAKMAKLGISGKFLEMLKTMYSGDTVDCVVNGVTTRCVYLTRGLRQGCSLSPILFNIYVSDIGHSLSSDNDGVLLGDKLRIAGLLFADDIIVVSDTAEGLRRLLSVVHGHCKDLKLTISQEKSQVISPDDDAWELFGDDGVEMTLKQVLHYKYLGVETFATMFKTCNAKLKKCVEVAKRYMFACLHLGKMSTDVVRISLATWESIAVPTVTYGCESIIVSEAKFAELESVESKVAKRILGVANNTSNVCAQTELGLKPIRLVIYLKQLKFFFRVLRLSSRRWVKVALLDHMSGSWQSPYLTYICKLRIETSLHSEPPTLHYLSVHLHQWALAMTNETVLNQTLPCVEVVTSFKKKRYVFSHKSLSTLASFHLSNGGLGNKYPLPGFLRFDACPHCTAPYKLDEQHLLLVCSAVMRMRQETGVDQFRTQSQLKGCSLAETYYLFVTGRSLAGKMVTVEDYMERGAAIGAIKSAWVDMLNVSFVFIELSRHLCSKIPFLRFASISNISKFQVQCFQNFISKFCFHF